jgi:hypothetical protein
MAIHVSIKRFHLCSGLKYRVDNGGQGAADSGAVLFRLHLRCDMCRVSWQTWVNGALYLLLSVREIPGGCAHKEMLP